MRRSERLGLVIGVGSFAWSMADSAGTPKWTLLGMLGVTAAGACAAYFMPEATAPGETGGADSPPPPPPPNWPARAVIAALVIAAASTFVWTARSVGTLVPGKGSSAAIVVLDTSRRLEGADGRGYSAAVADVVAAIRKRGGTVILTTIDEAAGPAGFERRFELDPNVPLARRGRQEQFIRLSASGLLRTAERRPRNPIRGALRATAAYFHAYPDADSKYVVLFSPLIERSERLDLRKQIPRAGLVVQRDRAEGLLPDLRGVDVYLVVGETETALASRRVRFWTTYIRSTGGRLAADPGGALIRFP
jgi:hypothetical protein